MDLTLQHHLPDISDVSVAQVSSEASFQIPHAVASTSQLLLEDDCPEFLCGMDDTISTPALSMRLRKDDPLTLAELTPRSKLPRFPSKHSPAKARPAISSPLKRNVASNLSIAMEDTLSPFKQQELSFQIPRIGNDISELLMANDRTIFFGKESDCSFPDNSSFNKPSTEALTLSQLTPDSVAETSGVHNVDDLSESNSLPFPRSSAFPALQAELETLLDGSEGSGHKIPEGPSSSLSSHAVGTESNRPSILDDPQKDTSTDEDMRSCPLPEERSTESEQAVRQFIRPRAASIKPDEHKLTVKRSVIEGGIVKRTKPKVLRNTTTRSKASAQRKLGTRDKSLARSTSASLASTSSAGSPSNNRDPSNSGSLARDSVSYGQQQAISVTDSQTTIQLSVTGSDLRRVVEDTALPCDSVRQVPASAAGDHDSDRPSTCHEDFTHRHVSPSEDQAGHTEEAAPGTAETKCDNLSSNSQQHGILCEPPHKMPNSYPVVPPSPMKAASKRAADATPDDASPPVKRGRIVPSTSESSQAASSSTSTSNLTNSIARTGVTTRARSKALQSSRVRPSRSVFAASDSVPLKKKSATGALKRAVSKPGPASNTTSRPVATSTGETNRHTGETRQVDASTPGHDSVRPDGAFDAIPTTSDSRTLGSENHYKRGTRSTSAVNDQNEHMTKSTGAHAHTRLAASLPPAKVTKPIEFHFHSDARIEARKKDFAGEGGSSTLRRTTDIGLLPIPDFKSMHEAEAQRLAARKEQIVPLLPAHMELNTETRAQERGAFDEARRAREMEAERLLEERRRLEAIEEEKEIRELRRRAVPKANEVPEWYARAPKRSRDAK